MRGSKFKGGFKSNGVKFEVRDDGLYKLNKNKKMYEKIPDKNMTKSEKLSVNNIKKLAEEKDIKTQLGKWTSEILDEEAKARKYDNMKSVRTYTGYPNIYQKECVELALWSSNSWYVLETIEEKVLNGSIKINNKEELKAQLPAFNPSV